MLLPSLVNCAKSYFYFESKVWPHRGQPNTRADQTWLDFTAVFKFCGFSCVAVAEVQHPARAPREGAP